MGCWNATCGISQMSIPAGEKVKAILILQSDFAKEIQGSGSCYHSTFFRPWFLPVTARYNDYGSIEDIEDDWNSQYMLRTFQKWHKEGKVKILGDDAEINSPGIDKFETLDEVFDCVERGALLYQKQTPDFDQEKKEWVNTGRFLKVGLFMILEDVYQALLKESDRFMNLPEHDYYKKSGDEDRNKFIDSINVARESFGKELTETEKLIRECRFESNRFLGDCIEEHFALKHYREFIDNPNSVPLDEFMKRMDDLRSISMSMSYLRKLWFPQCGSGSQSEELSFTKALIEGMNNWIKSREEEFRKRDEEDAAWEKQYEAEQAAKKAAKKAKQPKKKKGKK